jgi:hypothetical protein
MRDSYIARAARIDWPIERVERIDRYRAREKRKELKRWASLKSHGKAIKAFANNGVANAWLSSPTIFRPSKYITALKLRANVAAEKVALQERRLRKISCRRCRVQKETLEHILGQCTYTKKLRRERHDEIKDFILGRIVEKDRGSRY